MHLDCFRIENRVDETQADFIALLHHFRTKAHRATLCKIATLIVIQIYYAKLKCNVIGGLEALGWCRALYPSPLSPMRSKKPPFL